MSEPRRMGNVRTSAAVILAIALLSIAGIPTSNARAAPTPTLSIISPSDGAVIGNGSAVAIVFAVTNFTLADPGTGSSSPNVGHVEVFVDNIPRAKASANTVVLSLPSGVHAVRLQLVTDNGSALNPDVTASVSVMTTRGPAEGTPGVSIAFPLEGAVVGTDLTISYRVTNFVLAAPGGPAGVPNEGHIHALVDNEFFAELTEYEPLHVNLKDGPHRVTLRLVDNDHAPLIPAIEASVGFTVKALTGRIVQFDATPYFAGANLLIGLAILAAIFRKLEVR